MATLSAGPPTCASWQRAWAGPQPLDLSARELELHVAGATAAVRGAVEREKRKQIGAIRSCERFGLGDAMRGEFEQRAVVQDDVGRDALVARLVGAPLAQRVEERSVGGRDDGARGFPARRASARSLALGARDVATQREDGFALEYRARRFGQLERAVGLRVGFEQAGGEQLAED